jgi:hypothetical protein
MESTRAVQEQMDRAVELGKSALSTHDLLQVERLDQKLRTLDALCRELFQETLSDAYTSIAAKLDRAEALDPGERKAVELLFTGEAEYYLKTENNYEDWIAELRRLMAEIQSTREGGLNSLADLMHVQALCRDAMHVLPEVQYYLREKERVALFRESLTGEISPEEGKMLARMIRDLMSSPHR